MPTDGTLCGGSALGGCVGWGQFLAFLAPVALGLAAVVGLLLWDASRTPAPTEAAARANRHATIASTVAAVPFITALAWVFGSWVLGLMPRDGRLLGILPAIAGTSMLAVQAVGQLTWPRPTGARREADLAPRTPSDVAPRSHRMLAAVWSGLCLLLIVLFGLKAEGPRTLVQGIGSTNVPYPGWYYGVPIGLGVVIVVVSSEAVLRLIAVRPAVDGVGRAWDLHLRRRSAGHVVKATQLVLAVTASGLLASAGWVHLALARDPEASSGTTAHGPLGVCLLVAALVVLIAATVAAGSRLRQSRRVINVDIDDRATT